MGHALVAASLPGVDPVQKVSIIPRGVGALGYTMQRPTEDRFLLARSELLNRIAVLMGGRAAEEMMFDGDVSTGAADDLQRATEIAVEMVTRYGMDADGRASGSIAQPPRRFSASPQDRYAERRRSDRARDRPRCARHRRRGGRARRAMLRPRRSDLDEGARLLLTKETLTAEDFPALRPMLRAAEAAAEEARPSALTQIISGGAPETETQSMARRPVAAPP